MAYKLVICILGVGLGMLPCSGQEPEKRETVPTAVQWTLDAAGPTQRAAIKSVVLLVCPKTNMKGTGFVLSNGLIVTNNHVVEGCAVDQMKANPGAQEFGFTKMATDKDVDLALLRPTKHLTGGLTLGSDKDPLLGTPVTTWGFPLMYNGPAPLLSVGYVAGYVTNGELGKKVKHLVVNGAFNPGNSGGPLLRANDNRVIGVVVTKWTLYLPEVQKAIQTIGRYDTPIMTFKNERGEIEPAYFDYQLSAMVLDQFYRTTQVMIGEAISVSELRAFILKKIADVQ